MSESTASYRAPTAARLLALGLAPTFISLLLLLLVPPVGVLVSISFAVLLNPFGRTLVERFAVWLIAFLATDAIGFLVAGLRVNFASAVAMLLLSVGVAGGTAALQTDVRGYGTLRDALPKTGSLDLAVLLAGAIEAVWLLRPFVGVGNVGKLARLIVGWDFHTHFVLFADTFQYGRLADLSIRSSPEFATSATLLHPNLWALLAHALAGPAANPSRQQLLTPYIALTALTAAACVALLTWVTGHLTYRLAGRNASTWFSLTAAALFTTYSVVSGPSALFFVGHTPFLLAVTLVLVTSHLAGEAVLAGGGRQLITALVVTGAATVAIGFEWPPLLLGLAPAGVLLLRAFAKTGQLQRGITVAAILAAAGVAVPAARILQQRVGLSVLAHAVGGNAQFSVAAAIVSIPLAVLAAFWLIQRGDGVIAACAAGPVVGFAVFAVVLIAGGARWQTVPLAYYFLKTLHGVLLAALPLLLAVVVSALARHAATPAATRWHDWTAATVVCALGVCLLKTPTSSLIEGIPVRLTAASSPTRDAVIVLRSNAVTDPDPASLPFHWNYHNLLLNRWIVGLVRPESLADDAFYLRLMFTPTAGLAKLVCGDLALDPGRRFQLITVTPSLTHAWLVGISDRTCPVSRITISVSRR